MEWTQSRFSIFYNNVLAVNNILFSAKPKLKIVFISSSGVYGDGDFNESINIPFPKSSYGISKLLGEKLIIQFSKIKNSISQFIDRFT